MANENTPNETNETPAPIEVYAPDRLADFTKGMDAEGLERARRLHRIDPKLYKSPDVPITRVNPADKQAYDELLKKDDAAKAKEDAAKKAGEESWEDLEKRTQDDQQQGEGTGLQVPMEVPRDDYLRVEQYVQALGPLVASAGFDQETAQEVIDHAVSLAVMDQSGVSLEDPDACVTVLQRQLGGDEAAGVIRDAQDAADKLGEEFKNFLRETQLGNSPAVLQALAAYTRGEFSMSATAAQAELDKLTRDPKSAYRDASHKQHKSAVAKANRLYARVAKAEARHGKQPKSGSVKPGRTESIERELKAAIADPAYRHPGPGHAEAVARAERLYRERYGDE
jgi:hypothetical protein